MSESSTIIYKATRCIVKTKRSDLCHMFGRFCCLSGFIRPDEVHSGQNPGAGRNPAVSSSFRMPSGMAVKSLGFTSDKIRPFPDAVRMTVETSISSRIASDFVRPAGSSPT